MNVIDDHSRLLIASDALVIFKAADVVASFHRGAAAHGFCASLLTDNGAVFNAAPRGGRCAIELECARLGIGVVHSRPYHPQTCGKERFHQTLKRFLAKQEPAANMSDLQPQLDRFRSYYNTVRPHRRSGGAPLLRRTRRGPKRHRRWRVSRCRVGSGCAATRSISPVS